MPNYSTLTKTALAFLQGIKSRDADRMRAICHPNTTMCLIRQGKPFYTLVEKILDRVRQDDGVDMDEVSYDEIEHVDGDFATVWTPYRFYEDGKLHHTGTNNFTLWKSSDEGWLIIGVQDVARYLDGVTPNISWVASL